MPSLTPYIHYSKRLQQLAITIVAAYLRNTPLSKGRYRLVHTFLPLLREIGERMGQRLVTTRPGFKLNLNLAEWISQHIYMTGNFEPPTARLITSLLHDGDTMIDVGANIGFFTLLASRKVGALGKIIAFEPVSSTCAALRNNLSINGTVNVNVQEIALSNVDGTATIYEGPARNKGLSSMRPIDNASNKQSVPMAAFDSLEISRESIHLIKIDVEGAEQLVVEGMMECLKRNRPHLIIEITDAFLQEFGYSATSLYQKLIALGYRIYEITDRGPISMPNEPAAWPRQFNALFTVDPVLN